MKLEEAIFIERVNRFTARVLRNGKVIEAYLPNPGRLWELLIKGRKVYLEEGSRYILWAVEKDEDLVCLHTHYTNIVAERLIKEERIPDLEGFRVKEREIKLGNKRIDFLLENVLGKKLFLEVKSCTLFKGTLAMFPDAVTERGRKHIEVLSSMPARENALGGVLFIVHSPRVNYFLPEFHTDPLFSKTLYRAKDLLVLGAVSVKWNSSLEFSFVKNLSIPWHIYEKEAKNKGSYILIGELEEDRELLISSKKMNFRKGYYIYVGSAMNSLSSRTKRHLRKTKKLRWHIDYLTTFMKRIKTLNIESSEPLECQIARSIGKIADGFAKNFGSSDCSCLSHLYWMKENPLQDEGFMEILLKFRIERLSAKYDLV